MCVCVRESVCVCVRERECVHDRITVDMMVKIMHYYSFELLQ